MSVLGLDISLTSCGCVVLSNNGEILFNGAVGYGLKKPRETDRQKRIYDIVNYVEEILSDYGPGLQVAVEEYAYNQRFASQSITGLAEVTGAVKFLLYQWGIEPIVIPATQARKIVFESPVSVTKAERTKKITIKDKLRDRVFQDFGHEFGNDDETDAFVVAEAIRKMSVGGELSPEVLESLRKVTKRRKKGEKSGK